MSDKVQEAITATRAGEKRSAQLLLTEELQENPNNEHAWFLLGNLVDSPEKRMAYLGKTLAINPQHQKARQQFSQIYSQHEAEPIAAEGDFFGEPSVVLVKEEEETRVIDDDADMPDWLADQLKEDDLDVETPATVAETSTGTQVQTAETKALTIPDADATKDETAEKLKRYNQILALLVLTAIIVLLALLWTLFV